MHYQIIHTTTYTYEQPVVLAPHQLRLRPRCDGMQSLLNHLVQIDPHPLGISPVLDPEGNAIASCWWSPAPMNQLQVKATSEVITHCTNPFHYLLEPWATQLPIDYPTSIAAGLHPYFSHTLLSNPDPVAVQLAQEIGLAVDWQTGQFLIDLNQRIYTTCQYQVRATGRPWPPGITWTQRAGTCRDFVVLFIAVCQVAGLAARFVSGYEQGDPDQEQVLHAWAEVYLPGAGWRGYDPTHGLVVSDRHVALAASAWPHLTAPVTGSHRGGLKTPPVMAVDLSIQALSPIPG